MDSLKTAAKPSPEWDEHCKNAKRSVIPSDPKSVATQFIHYSMVGGVAFVVDFVLFSMVIALGGHYLLATFLGFLVGVVVSYLLCVVWVWRGTQARTRRDLLLFTAIGICGLLLTAALMWVGVDLLSLQPQLAKVCVAVLVLAWNFGLRRAFVFFR